MRKRFTVATDSATDEQNEAMVEYIRSRGLTWWHWIHNYWLIADAEGELTASELVDDLKRIYPEVNTVVLELRADGDTWAGWGPRAKFFTWLRKEWKRKIGT